MDFANTFGIKFLLSMRESSNSLVMSPGWDVHSQGLTALIRLRGPENFVTQDGRNLFWIVFNSLVSLAIDRCSLSLITLFASKFNHRELARNVLKRALHGFTKFTNIVNHLNTHYSELAFSPITALSFAAVFGD